MTRIHRWLDGAARIPLRANPRVDTATHQASGLAPHLAAPSVAAEHLIERTTEHHPDPGKSSFPGPIPRVDLCSPALLVRPAMVLDRRPGKSQLAHRS